MKMWCIFLHIPLALKHVNSSAIGFIPIPFSISPAKWKGVCHITVAIMENESREVGMSLYYHGNRQTVLMTGSFKVSLKYWKHFLVLSSYANKF